MFEHPDERTLTCGTLFEDVIDNWWCKRWLRKPLWLRRQETSVTDGVIWRCGCTRCGARLLPSRALFFRPLLLRMWGLRFYTLLMYIERYFRTWMLLWWGSRTYVLKSCLILITSEYSSAPEICQKLKWGQVTEGDLGLWPQFVTRLWFRYIDPTQVFSVLCNPDKNRRITWIHLSVYRVLFVWVSFNSWWTDTSNHNTRNISETLCLQYFTNAGHHRQTEIRHQVASFLVETSTRVWPIVYRSSEIVCSYTAEALWSRVTTFGGFDLMAFKPFALPSLFC